MKKQRDRQTLSVYVMSVKKRNKTSARVGSSFEALPVYHQMEYHPFYDFIFTFFFFFLIKTSFSRLKIIFVHLNM
jgi:hypothetical protein